MSAAPGLGALFGAFLKAGLLGFGGVAPWAHRIVVEERRWLDDAEYAELLGLGQVLPGPNVVNLAVMIGDRFRGPLGALSALAGLLAAPLAVLIGLALLYDRFGALPRVQGMLGGMAAAGAGLVLGTGFKMARRLRPGPGLLGVGLLAFLGAGVLRLPLPLVVLALAPLGIALAARGGRA